MFNSLQPNLNGTLSSIREELHMWDIAGAASWIGLEVFWSRCFFLIVKGNIIEC